MHLNKVSDIPPSVLDSKAEMQILGNNNVSLEVVGENTRVPTVWFKIYQQRFESASALELRRLRSWVLWLFLPDSISGTSSYFFIKQPLLGN